MFCICVGYENVVDNALCHRSQQLIAASFSFYGYDLTVVCGMFRYASAAVPT